MYRASSNWRWRCRWRVYFHRVTVFALPVNILILPLLAVLMPAALLTLLASLVSSSVAVVPAAVTALLLHLGVGLVKLFGSAAVGDLRIPAPLPMQAGAFCVLLGLAVVLARRANLTGAHWPRRTAWVAMIAAAVAVVMPRPIEHPHDALLVEAIDVGQGDSLLLITPDGKTMLVDGRRIWRWYRGRLRKTSTSAKKWFRPCSGPAEFAISTWLR